MLTRRGFGGCAVCAAVGLVAAGAEAQPQAAQTSGVTRTIVQTTDLDERTTTLLVTAEIAAGATVARHTHPGIESTYIIDGACELSVHGMPDRKLKTGEGFQIPPGAPHGVKNGDRPTKLAITYIVEKGKPLASPA